MSSLVYLAPNYPKQPEWMGFFLPRLVRAQTLSQLGKICKRQSWTNAQKYKYITGNFWSSSHPEQPDLQFVELHLTILMVVSANTCQLFLETLSHPPGLERNSCCPCHPSPRRIFSKHFIYLRSIMLFSGRLPSAPTLRKLVLKDVTQ